MKANLSGANLQHARNLTQRQLYGTFGKRLHGAAAININRGFAGEFIVRQGKRYRATLALNSVEQLANNALIARRFRALGLSRVRVSGSGARLARSTKHRSRPKPTSNGSAKNQRPKIGRRATQETPSEIG